MNNGLKNVLTGLVVVIITIAAIFGYVIVMYFGDAVKSGQNYQSGGYENYIIIVPSTACADMYCRIPGNTYTIYLPASQKKYEIHAETTERRQRVEGKFTFSHNMKRTDKFGTYYEKIPARPQELGVADINSNIDAIFEVPEDAIDAKIVFTGYNSPTNVINLTLTEVM